MRRGFIRLGVEIKICFAINKLVELWGTEGHS
jgi:hypothetical protein